MNAQWRRHASVVIAVVGVLLTLSGCSSDWARGGLPEGATDQSQSVQNLWMGAWIAALIVGVGVWGMILWACVAYRRKRHDAPLPPQVRYNVPIEALYSVLPFIIIAVMFTFVARDQSQMTKLSDHPDQVITVIGRQWSWDFAYTTANTYESGTPDQPPTLYLPKGQKVRFKLEAMDVIHSFWVPEFLFKRDVIPGRTNEFEVTPQRLGTFAGKCAELCGQDHARMLFQVRVVEPDEYQAHLEALKAQGHVGMLPVEQLGPAQPGVRDSQGSQQ